MIHRAAAFLCVTLVVALIASPIHAQSDQDVPTWPREFPLADGGKLVVYQPQIERWDDFKQLQALVAVSFEAKGKDAILGSLRISAGTDTDQVARQVVFSDIKVAQTSFPTLEASDATAAAKEVADVFPKGPVTLSLDRVLANVDREAVKIREVAVLNDPPQIYMSNKNATLAILDGDPVYQRVGRTDVFMLVNTPAYLFRHGRFEQYYMIYGRGWVTSDHLTRGWEPENSLPDTFSDVPTGPQWQGVRARIPGKLMPFADMPEVFVAQPSAELLQFQREPIFQAVPGTNLEYATNSNSDVFRHKQDGQHYMLISGRWFRAPGIDSPLQYCSGSLPDDFAKIPNDHTCGRVRPCVPGTPEADEAVIAAHIPRAAKVKRGNASLEVTYVGDPSFVPIEGTGVEYAANTSLDVFRVGGGYYACHDAIWYQATSAGGPWTVCDSVPSAIYSISPDSPKFHVTFAFVDTTTPDEVLFTYYPGYRHTFVAGDTVVYGTGRYYQMPKEYYVHYFQNPHLHANDHVAALQTYGYGYFYDHLSGGFQVNPATRTHHMSSTSPAGPYLAWASAAVAAVPYGATGMPAPPREPGSPMNAVSDLYAGSDGNVYSYGRENMSWAMYGAGRRWGRPMFGSRTAAWVEPPRVGIEPGSWTRVPATQRGLAHHTLSRGLMANNFRFYQMNYYANRTQ